MVTNFGGIIKTIILAGGLGTRLSEETQERPKPMVMIHNKPMISHIMDIYQASGFYEFIFALGYKGDFIKRWIIDQQDLSGNIFADFEKNIVTRERKTGDTKTKIYALDTGLYSQTGGRIQACMKKFEGESMLATYGDGLGNINVKKLVDFHKSHGKLATVTAVRPPARFGEITIQGKKVVGFSEKPQTDSGWINGGFFVLEPEVSNFVLNPDEPFETGALPRLADEGELMAYKHDGFWMPMDTIREKNKLVELANLPTPPWLNF